MDTHTHTQTDRAKNNTLLAASLPCAVITALISKHLKGCEAQLASKCLLTTTIMAGDLDL